MEKHRTSNNALDLSIIVPLLNEESNIDFVTKAIIDEVNKLNLNYELILIDDGSNDNTWLKIKNAANNYSLIKGISLSRNFGHQNAIMAGIQHSSGRAIVTMDGDLQHPPKMIGILMNLWREGYKIVNTQRIDSPDTTILKRLTSRLFYRFFSWISGMPMASGTSDFRLIDEQVAEVLCGVRDADLFLRGIVHWAGFPTTSVTYEAGERHSGVTKFSLMKMIRFSIAAVVSFSLVPLKLGVYLGLFTSLLAFAELAYILVKYFQGATVPGWASVLTIVSFMFAILFILIGTIGAYIGSIFEVVRDRPHFLVNDIYGFSDDS